MRGVVAFRCSCCRRANLRRRQGPRRIDAAAQLSRIGFRDQPLDRRLHAHGVAEEGGAVGIGELHRLDHQVQPARVVAGEVAVAFEDVENLDQDHAAGGGRRHRHDVVAAIAAAHRRALDRPVVLEVLARHHAAGRAHRRGDPAGDLALVERSRAAARDRRQRLGEVALHQRRAGGEQLPVGTEENLGARRPALQAAPLTAAASSAMS